MSDEFKALAQDIRQQLDAVGQRLSDEAIEQRITAAVDKAVNSEPFKRATRFGDARLAGSKYGRLGLGISDIEILHSILTSARISGKSKGGPSEDLDNAFKALSEGRYMDTIDAKAADVRSVEEMYSNGRMDTAGFYQALAAIDSVYHKRAMDTAETGYGLQLVGVQYVSDLWAGARAASRVYPLIPTFPMTQPTTYLPVEADLPEMLFVGESTTYNAANYTTSKTGSNRVQVDAKKFVIHQMWSGEMEEDALIPYIPFLRAQATRSLAHYSDSLILNGDTTNAGTGNINLDDADPADTKHYLALDGLRHGAIVDATGQCVNHGGVAITYDAMVNLRKYGVDATYLHDWFHPADPSDAVYLVNPDLGDELAKLDEVVTVDKYGANATILTGEVGNIGRNPLVASIAMSKTEADGKVSTTAGNNTLHQAMLFNRRGYVVGVRRALQVETERIIGSDQSRIVFSLRVGFGRYTPTGAAAGIKSVAVLRNIA